MIGSGASLEVPDLPPSGGTRVSVMLADRRIQSVLGALVLLIGVAWISLLLVGPGVLMSICSAASSAGNGSRAMALFVMWSLMTPAMMLPCATAQIVGASWARRRHEPVLAAALAFTLGYLALLAPAGITAATVQWSLESIGAIDGGSRLTSPALTGSFLLIASSLEMAKVWCGRRIRPVPETVSALDQGLRHGRSRLIACVQMICLQFVGGAMDIAWMAVLTIWMLAGTILPRTKPLSMLVSLALLGAAGLAYAGLPV